QQLERALLGEDPRRAEAELSRQQVVDLEAEAVERRLPPVVVRYDEGEVTYQVRRVLAQQPALLQRLHHEGDVALLEVAHAAVNELRAPARRPLAEVALLEEESLVATGGSVDGNSAPGGPAADDDHVPRLLPLLRAADHVGAIEPHSRSTIAGSPSNRKVHGRRPGVLGRRIATGLPVPRTKSDSASGAWSPGAPSSPARR